MIKVFHDPFELRAEFGSCALTIGKYDGMHLGHQKILDVLKQEARSLQVPTLVLLSEPQPEEFFAGSSAPARLNSFEEKVGFLEMFGINAVFCLEFTEQVSKQSPQFFIQDFLCQGLGMKGVVVGEDFRFGHQRRGSVATMVEMASTNNYKVVGVGACSQGGERISSTLLRQYLQSGELKKVTSFLGRPYSISGRVVEGQQLGRELGYPTANVNLMRDKLPLSGIFAVKVHLNSDVLSGVASLGFNPTVSNNDKPKLEVHLFNFSNNIYGQTLKVEFVHKLRDEIKFANVKLLKAQIEQDVAMAKILLAD